MLDAHPGPGKFKNQKKPFMPQYPSALYHVVAGDKLARLLPNPLTFTIGAGATALARNEMGMGFSEIRRLWKFQLIWLTQSISTI